MLALVSTFLLALAVSSSVPRVPTPQLSNSVKALWKTAIEESTGDLATLASGRRVLLSTPQSLYCFSDEDGTIIWRADTPANFIETQFVSVLRTRVIVARTIPLHDQSTIESYDLSSGTLLDKIQIHGRINSRPTELKSGILICVRERAIRGVDPADLFEITVDPLVASKVTANQRFPRLSGKLISFGSEVFSFDRNGKPSRLFLAYSRIGPPGQTWVVSGSDILVYKSFESRELTMMVQPGEIVPTLHIPYASLLAMFGYKGGKDAQEKWLFQMEPGSPGLRLDSVSQVFTADNVLIGVVPSFGLLFFDTGGKVLSESADLWKAFASKGLYVVSKDGGVWRVSGQPAITLAHIGVVEALTADDARLLALSDGFLVLNRDGIKDRCYVERYLIRS